jgi:hypothetical protein
MQAGLDYVIGSKWPNFERNGSFDLCTNFLNFGVSGLINREMKQFLLSIGFLLFSFSFVAGQSWPPVAGESSSACGATTILVQGAQGAGSTSPALSWPMNKVVMILREARSQFSGMNLGQMIQAYHNCGCVITYLGEGWFRVAIGGGISIVAIGGDL